MPIRARKSVVRDIPDKRAWNQLVHDVANDLAALNLLLVAIGLADNDQERSRHLGAAKQTLVEGAAGLQALREAVQRELGESSSTDALRQRSKRAGFVDHPPKPADFEHPEAAERVSAPSGAKASSKRAAKSAARPLKKRSA